MPRETEGHTDGDCLGFLWCLVLFFPKCILWPLREASQERIVWSGAPGKRAFFLHPFRETCAVVSSWLGRGPGIKYLLFLCLIWYFPTLFDLTKKKVIISNLQTTF